jgi:hypothetical protein
MPEQLRSLFQWQTLVIDDFRDLSIYGSKSKGWKSPVQDKGHLDELRVFASFRLRHNESPIHLDELIETTKISFITAGIEG